MVYLYFPLLFLAIIVTLILIAFLLVRWKNRER